MRDWAHSRRLGIPADEAGSVVLRQPPASKLANLLRIDVRNHALGLVTQQLGGRVREHPPGGSLLKQHPGRDSLAMKRRSSGWSEDFMLEVPTGATIWGKSGVGSSFLPEKMNRHGITRKDELTPDYRTGLPLTFWQRVHKVLGDQMTWPASSFQFNWLRFASSQAKTSRGRFCNDSPAGSGTSFWIAMT